MKIQERESERTWKNGVEVNWRRKKWNWNGNWWLSTVKNETAVVGLVRFEMITSKNSKIHTLGLKILN